MKEKFCALKARTLHRINTKTLTLFASIYFVAIFNFSFWARFTKATGNISLGNIFLHIAVFIMLVAAFNGLLTFATFRPIFKPVLIFFFIASSAAAYFMDRYGILIDASLIQSLSETDIYEASDLLSWRLIFTVFLFGVLPSIAIWYARLPAPSTSLKQRLIRKTKVILFSLATASVIFAISYKPLAPVLREAKELRFLLTPTNYIKASYGHFKYKIDRFRPALPLGTDATRGYLWKPDGKKSVMVIVVGESARAKNFSLNGYGRDTNPKLSKQVGLINFSNFQSCGTATAVSVPCVFSGLGRENYIHAAGRSENLLDVLTHAGFNVIWRDNNVGCNGVCNRIPYEDLSRPVDGEPLCTSKECYDERLLQRLPSIIRASEKDIVIVLHQRGSHYTYWKRYPKEFEHFAPACKDNDLPACETESLVNVYDNTILYTDHVLSKTINLLNELAISDKIDASMIYFSDHGQSLGEKGIYTHATPYATSPIEQRHIPMIMWFSDGFSSRFGIDMQCMAKQSAQPFSHDNVFHSVLGMLNINTKAYNSNLDMFKSCSSKIR